MKFTYLNYGLKRVCHNWIMHWKFRSTYVVKYGVEPRLLRSKGSVLISAPSPTYFVECPKTNIDDWCTGIARSRVQTPLKSWLFQASVRNCLNCVQNCDDHGLLDIKSAVQCMKHFIYHFTLQITFVSSYLPPYFGATVGYLWRHFSHEHYRKSVFCILVLLSLFIILAYFTAFFPWNTLSEIF